MKRRLTLYLFIILLAACWYERTRFVDIIISTVLTATTDQKIEYQLRSLNIHGAAFNFIHFPDLGFSLGPTTISFKDVLSSSRHINVQGESAHPVLQMLGAAKDTLIGLHSLKYTFDVRLEHKKTTLEIKKIVAKLFDGTIEVKPHKAALNSSPCHSLSLTVNHIGLSQLLALYQNDDITVSGSVKGTIPLTFCGKKFYINASTLTSEKGGSIKIRRPSESGNAGVDFAFLALQDFDYSSLDATLSMKENGAMSIALTMAGTSNSLNNKTPIVVHLNLEENLWALLHSLQITQKFTDSISD